MNVSDGFKVWEVIRKVLNDNMIQEGVRKVSDSVMKVRQCQMNLFLGCG